LWVVKARDDERWVGKAGYLKATSGTRSNMRVSDGAERTKDEKGANAWMTMLVDMVGSNFKQRAKVEGLQRL